MTGSASSQLLEQSPEHGVRALLLRIRPALRWPQALQAAHEPLSLGRLVLVALQLVDEITGRELDCIHAEALPKLVAPFLAEHGRAHNDETARVVARAQLRPDQPGLDGLSETDLVSDQDSAGRGLQKGENRLVLIRVEVRVRRVHAVHDVCEPSAEMNEGEVSPQIVESPEALVLQQGEDVVGLRGDLLQVVLRNPARRAVVPADLVDLSIRALAQVPC